MLIKLAKSNLSTDTYSSLKKIKSANERDNALRYLLLRKLEERYDSLGKNLSFLSNRNKDLFFANNYVSILKDKISNLKLNFSEHNLIRAFSLLDKAEKEVYEKC